VRAAVITRSWLPVLLHEVIRADSPPAYPSSVAAYREIVPTLRRQLRDPVYRVTRSLPETSVAR
jgi:hypothetical protein